MSKIMIIEDDPASQLLMREILKKKGYEPHIYGDGLEALDALGKVSPDLMIVDVMLPTINGYQICERVKADPDHKNTPIIMLTALNEDQHRIRAKEAGAMDFLSKPFNRVELLNKIETLLSMSRETASMISANDVVTLLSDLMYKRFPSLPERISQTCQYAKRISTVLGLSDDDLRQLMYAIKLKDVSYLSYPGEYRMGLMYPYHPGASAELVEPLLGTDVADLIRHHHDTLKDDSYPSDKPEHFLQMLRILLVCTRYDYLLSTLYPEDPAAAYAAIEKEAADGLLPETELQLLLQICR